MRIAPFVVLLWVTTGFMGCATPSQRAADEVDTATSHDSFDASSTTLDGARSATVDVAGVDANAFEIGRADATAVEIGRADADADAAEAGSPMKDFKVSSPEAQGMSSSKLEAAKNALAAKGTSIFLVMRNDVIVYEWYSANSGVDVRHGTASLAKALVGSISLAVAMTDGLIALDDHASKYIPQWVGVPRKRDILIRQLGSHSSGLADADHVPTGWEADFWARMPPPHDPFSISRDVTPMVFDPGTRGSYSNPGIGMLTYAVTAALRGSMWPDVRSLLRDRVMDPLGIPASHWNIGYNTTFNVGDLPLVASWGGANFTGRATARVGQLMIHQGQWNGVQLIDAKAVADTTKDAGQPGVWGQGWWHGDGLPADGYFGLGAGQEILFVVPSLGLIGVRYGAEFGGSNRRSLLFGPVLGAITNP
jgi:CubicO group peptidase (beta-lactamase class C family)